MSLLALAKLGQSTIALFVGWEAGGVLLGHKPCKARFGLSAPIALNGYR